MLSKRLTIWIFIPVMVILIGYVLYPSLRTFLLGADIDLIRQVFASWRSANVRALISSVWVSLLTVGGAAILGTALAYFFYRYDFAFKKTLMSVAALPLALPPLVGVLAFLFLYGESGILPRGLKMLFGLDEVPFAFEGFWAVLFVHIYTMYVYFYLFVMAALRGIDGSLLEASAGLGASSWTTFRKVILPLLKPSLLSASLLVFMISMASFTAPLLFAGTENFLTLQIYNYKMNATADNSGLELSATVSIVLTFICLIFLVLMEFSNRSQQGVNAGKGTASAAIPVRGGWAQALLTIGVVVLLLFLLLPIATVVLISFAEEGSWTYQLLPQRYTFMNYIALFADSDILQPILNSIRMALLATAGNMVFGVAVALLVAKGAIGIVWRDIVRVLAILPFAIPGTVIAINMIVAFNEPTPFSFGQILVGSFWILPLAYFVRHIPFVVRSTLAALEGYDDRLSEASSDLGADFFMTFRRVMLPVISGSILAGTLLTFVTALGEFVSSIVLYIFSNRPISVEILSQLRIYEFGSAAAYSVFLMILIGCSTLLVRRLGNSESVGRAF